MRFIETPIFTEVVYGQLEDEEYRRLQLALLLTGTGRKKRFTCCWCTPSSSRRT